MTIANGNVTYMALLKQRFIFLLQLYGLVGIPFSLVIHVSTSGILETQEEMESTGSTQRKTEILY